MNVRLGIIRILLQIISILLGRIEKHIFFSELIIFLARIKNARFTGNVQRSSTYNGAIFYNLEGIFEGTIDDLKINIYRGKFSIKDNNTPSDISGLDGCTNVSVQISNLEGRFFDLSYADYCKM